MIPEIQTWDQFKTSVEDEMNRRMRLYKQWTSIVPSANHLRKELSWYINKRNTPHTQIFQHTDVVNSGEISFQSQSEDAEDVLGDRRYSPDLLGENEGFWEQAGARYSEGQYQAAARVLKELPQILAPKTYEAWMMHQNGMTDTDIATALGKSPQAVAALLAGAERKIKRLYGNIRTNKCETNSVAN